MEKRRYIVGIICFLTLLLFFTLSKKFTGYVVQAEVITSKPETALRNVVKGKETLLELKDNTTCYWIKPTMNESNYLLQITVYKNIGLRCVGIPKERIHIVVDRPYNLYGKTCFCGPEKFVLKGKIRGRNGWLAIERYRPVPIWIKISLSVTEFLKNLFARSFK